MLKGLNCSTAGDFTEWVVRHLQNLDNEGKWKVKARLSQRIDVLSRHQTTVLEVCD